MKLRPVLPTLRASTLTLSAGNLPFPLAEKRTSLWYLGRNAIYAGLGALGMKPGDGALVPSYTNGVEVAAIAARRLNVTQVRIKPDLTLDLDDLEEKLRVTGAKLVLAIHYLGFTQPIDAIVAIARKHGARVFEDCALSFLAKLPDGRPAGSVGDLAVFSLYKTLPVPDGAALVINDPTVPDPVEPIEPDLSSSASGVGRLTLNGARMGGLAGQAAALALDLARRGAARWFARSGVERTASGSMKFETKRLAWGASRFARAILPRLDYAQIALARRKNFLRLRERLASVPTLFKTLPPGACPLFYPILVEDKDAVMRLLAARGIESVNFWSTWDPLAPPHDHPEIAWLRAHVVEIPCLQDLGPADMDFIADAVLDALGRRSSDAFALAGAHLGPPRARSLLVDELREPQDLRI